MTSKDGTLVVTGANGGLGRAIVSEFLRSPKSASYKGLWGVRAPAKATALQELLAKHTNASEHELVKIDISTLESTRASAADINNRVKAGELPPIRTLVLNAALQFVTGQTYTDEKLESSFAVNYLSNFLLILLLLQSMDKETGRIVIVSSWTHDVAHPLNGHIVAEEHKIIYRDSLGPLAQPGKDKAGDDYNSGMRRYGASKTLIILMMYELQRRLSASKDFSNVSVLAVDPGTMPGTDLFRDSSAGLKFLIHGIMGALTPLLAYFFPNGWFRSASKSAKDVLDASFAEGVLGKHPKGLYLNGGEISQSSAETKDEDKQKKLWEESVEMAGLKQEETALDLNKEAKGMKAPGNG